MEAEARSLCVEMRQQSKHPRCESLAWHVIYAKLKHFSPTKPSTVGYASSFRLAELFTHKLTHMLGCRSTDTEATHQQLIPPSFNASGFNI